jgi:HEAT repeat protein
MRKIFLFICVLLVSTAAFAQSPEGRTAKTIVADVLAQMPAQEEEQFNGLMRDLASTGEAGVLQLVGMMTPPGQGANARMEYALSGLTHWVSAEGSEAQLLATSNAYIKALGTASDREVKAFIIRQLGLIGGDSAVAVLNSLLGDAELKEPAVAALAAISGNALPRVAVSEDELVANAARVAAFAKAMDEDVVANSRKLLRKALKDDDRRYRYAALNIASRYPWIYSDVLLTQLPKASDAASVDVLNWLAQEAEDQNLRNTTLAPQASAAAIKHLKSDDLETVEAAAKLLSKTGGERAIAALAGLLKSSDDSVVGIAADALASTEGDIATAVAPLIPTLGNAGKVAALNLLAGRKSTSNSDVVFNEISGRGSSDVIEAAYEALKDVATAGDLDKLYTLLENASAENVSSVQQAISSALRTMSAAEQYAAVSERMSAAPAAKQYVYYPILAATGDAGALKLIVERFDSESGAAKDSAFDALISWSGVDAADKLLSICEDPAAAPYFDRAIARYTTHASDPSLSGGSRAMMLIDALDIARTDSQRRAILASMATTNSYMAMAEAGDYLEYDANVVKQAAAGAVMKIALDNPQFAGDEVRALLEKVITVLDNPDAGYEQQAIRKHLAEMSDPEPFELSDEERSEGFTVLFDGTNLDAWTGNKTDYRVENGTISLYPSESFGGNLYTAREYGDFVLRFEFQLTPGANNGVGIRTPKDVDAAYHGMEIQILDHDDPAYRNITTHQVHGSIYGVIGAKRAVLKHAPEWNVEEIVADGDRIRVTLNGEVILDGNIREASKNGTFDGLEHPGLFNKKGYIGFLGHGSHLKFRNIRIKE